MNMSLNYETLQFEVQGDLGILTINRPKALNALNETVHTELRSFLLSLRENNKDFEVRAILLTGSGEKAFIAGADIKQMQDMSDVKASEFSRLGQENTLLMEESTIPFIAGVNGFALGGGLEMALACDFILATNNAVFGLPEVKLGLIPGFGGTQRLARVVGRQRAKEMVYTGRNVTIEEALNMGLTIRSFETKEEMIEGAQQIVSQMKKNSPLAISVAKSVVNEGVETNIKDGLDLEVKSFGSIFNSGDMKEGVAAFIEKRKAEFKGK